MSETQGPQLGKIAKALLAAQMEISRVIKESENPFFKSKYADLSAVISHVKPILNKHKLLFIQAPAPATYEGYAALITTLMHEDGDFVSSTAETPLSKLDPQGYGSAITYLRRYSLAAMTGLMIDGDDDDAEGAVDHSKELRKPQGGAKLGVGEKTAPAKKKTTSLFPVPRQAAEQN